MKKIGKLIDLELHVDDRGFLSEIFRSDEEYFKKFGQVYIIGNERRDVIRAFHFHKRKEDYFYVSNGKAVVILVNKNRDIMSKYILDSKKPQLLVIPKETYHGWKSLLDNTHIINVVTEPFHSNDTDDYRIPYDTFGKKIWDIEFK